MENLSKLPPVRWALIHPRIAAWIVLSLGMVILLVIEARDVGLTAGNWIALIVATVLVAGLCILIVASEDMDEADADAVAVSPGTPPGTSASETIGAQTPVPQTSLSQTPSEPIVDPASTDQPPGR